MDAFETWWKANYGNTPIDDYNPEGIAAMKAWDARQTEIDRLAAQLPDGMKHCTIQFKECEKGHGWLTATNWVQHGCPTCERDRLAATAKSHEDQLVRIAAAIGKDARHSKDGTIAQLVEQLAAELAELRAACEKHLAVSRHAVGCDFNYVNGECDCPRRALAALLARTPTTETPR